MNTYLKLDKPPHLVFQAPICGTCHVSVTADADSYICPACGTSWGLRAGDDAEGDLYEEWSGEAPEGVAANRATAPALAQQVIAAVDRQSLKPSRGQRR